MFFNSCFCPKITSKYNPIINCHHHTFFDSSNFVIMARNKFLTLNISSQFRYNLTFLDSFIFDSVGNFKYSEVKKYIYLKSFSNRSKHFIVEYTEVVVPHKNWRGGIFSIVWMWQIGVGVHVSITVAGDEEICTGSEDGPAAANKINSPLYRKSYNSQNNPFSTPELQE